MKSFFYRRRFCPRQMPTAARFDIRRSGAVGFLPRTYFLKAFLQSAKARDAAVFEHIFDFRAAMLAVKRQAFSHFTAAEQQRLMPFGRAKPPSAIYRFAFTCLS